MEELNQQQQTQFTRLERLSKHLNDLCDELNLANLKLHSNQDSSTNRQNLTSSAASTTISSTNNDNNNKNNSSNAKQTQKQLESSNNAAIVSLLHNRSKFNLNASLIEPLLKIQRVTTKTNVSIYELVIFLIELKYNKMYQMVKLARYNCYVI